MIRVALQGFGEEGRFALEQLSLAEGYQVVAINFLGDQFHYKLFQEKAKLDMWIGYEKNIKKLPWKELKVDVVLDLVDEQLGLNFNLHQQAGAKKVIVSRNQQLISTISRASFIYSPNQEKTKQYKIKYNKKRGK